MKDKGKKKKKNMRRRIKKEIKT